MTGLAEAVREQGFADEREFHRMVASVDFTVPAVLKTFEYWKSEDGSKSSLSLLLTMQEAIRPHVKTE